MAHLTYLFAVALVASGAVASLQSAPDTVNAVGKDSATNPIHKEAVETSTNGDKRGDNALPANGGQRQLLQTNKDGKTPVNPKVATVPAPGKITLAIPPTTIKTPPVAKKAPPAKVAGILIGVTNVKTMGAALQPAFAKQWDNILAFNHKDFVAFEQKVLSSVSGSAASAVKELIAKVDESIAATEVTVRAFIKEQGIDVVALVTKYTTHIEQRLNATPQAASDETAILNLRKESQGLVLKWQTELLNLTVQSRINIRKIIKEARAASEQASLKATIRESGKKLLWRLIDEQVRVITLLTSTQTSQLNSFTMQGGKVLFQIAVAAQADSL